MSQRLSAGRNIRHPSRDELLTGSNAIYANGIGRTAVNTKIADEDILSSKGTEGRNLQACNETGQRIREVQYNAYSSSFIGVCHVYAEQTLRLQGFIPVEKYASQQDIMEGSLGSMQGSVLFRPHRPPNSSEAEQRAVRASRRQMGRLTSTQPLSSAKTHTAKSPSADSQALLSSKPHSREIPQTQQTLSTSAQRLDGRLCTRSRSSTIFGSSASNTR